MRVAYYSNSMHEIYVGAREKSHVARKTATNWTRMKNSRIARTNAIRTRVKFLPNLTLIRTYTESTTEALNSPALFFFAASKLSSENEWKKTGGGVQCAWCIARNIFDICFYSSLGKMARKKICSLKILNFVVW